MASNPPIGVLVAVSVYLRNGSRPAATGGTAETGHEHDVPDGQCIHCGLPCLKWPLEPECGGPRSLLNRSIRRRDAELSAFWVLRFFELKAAVENRLHGILKALGFNLFSIEGVYLDDDTVKLYAVDYATPVTVEFPVRLLWRPDYLNVVRRFNERRLVELRKFAERLRGLSWKLCEAEGTPDKLVGCIQGLIELARTAPRVDRIEIS